MEAALPFLVLFLLIMNLVLSKWLFNEKRNKISEKNAFRWGMVILGLISIAVYIFIAVTGEADSNAVKWFWPIFFIIIFSFESFMEWKYLKESKQYVIPLILLVLSLICLTGIYFIDHQMKFTTFQEEVSDLINEDTTVREISIYINDLSENRLEREARTTIEDPKIIDRILHDISNIELKESDDDYRGHKRYRIQLITTNRVEEDHYSTQSFYVELDEKSIFIPDSYANYFQIISDSNHLKTIESLVKSDDIEWQYIEE